MQKGRVLKLKNFGIIEFFKNNTFLLTVTFIFTVGFFIGIFTVDGFFSLKDYSDNYIKDYIALRLESSFFNILLHSLVNYLAVLFILFVLGASFFGVITVPVAIFAKGMLNGGVSAYLYSQYGLKGIAFNAVIIIPPTIVFLIILLISSRESVKFSLKLSSLTLSKTLPFNMSEDFKDYTIKYSILAACTFICSLLDAIISSGLIKKITL